MASVTLAESAKLAQDELVQGLIETIVTVNPWFELLPFEGIDGNSLAYNREALLGGVISAGVGVDLSSAQGGEAKRAATFTRVNSNLTKIIGDAEVDNLIQATRSADNDQKGIQIASKAKAAARKYQDMLINGTGMSDEFTGLLGLCANSQKVHADTAGSITNGGVLTFELMDELLDLVTDKDAQVDYIMMHARDLRKFRSLLRGLGGTSPVDVYTMPSGAEVMAYNGIPVFRNDYIPTNLTTGSANNTSVIIAGTLDDGSLSHGIGGLTAREAAGISVVEVGQSEFRDEEITRVRWYCGLANYSQLGLAVLDGVIPG
jgi:hypothetical protein